MSASPSPSLWAHGPGYEQYMGRWSRRLAREFISWLDRPEGGSWLDVGCGTGAVSSAVIALANPDAVTGIDPSAGFTAYAADTIADPRFRTETGSAGDLPFPAAAFDTVVSGLMLNFVPEPARAVAEMTRVAKPGGVVALYVWDYKDGQVMMQHFWDAAIALDPAIREAAESRRFVPVCHPDVLARLFTDAGLRDVETRDLVIPMRFVDFDDYWRPFLGGQGPAPSYAATLPPERLSELRDALRAALPTASDGSITLDARAFAVRGVRHQRSTGAPRSLHLPRAS